MYRKVLID